MQSEPKKNKRAVTVGLFVFLGLLFLFGGILAIGNLRSTFSNTFMLNTAFQDVNGLQVGNNVWFSGVKIGTVRKMTLAGESQVQVELKIQEKARHFIRKDAKAKISTDGLIGNKIIVIYGGSPNAQPVDDGDVLGIETMVSTEEMMNTLQQNNRNLLEITTDFKAISDKLAGGQGTVGKLLHDEALYNSLGNTAAALQRSSAHAENLTAQLSQYGAKLNRPGTLANQLVTDTTVFNEVQASVRQLKQVTTSASEAAGNLKTASANVTQVTEKLDDRNTPLGVLLYDQQSAANIRSILNNLEGSTEKLDENMRAVQDNFLLRRYFKKKAKEEEKTQKLNPGPAGEAVQGNAQGG